MNNPEIGVEAFKKVIDLLDEVFDIKVDKWTLQFNSRKATWIFIVDVGEHSITLIIPLLDLNVIDAAEDVVVALEELKK